MGWSVSSLRCIRQGTSGRSRRTSGVRRAPPAMRSRAFKISSGRGGSTARITQSSQLDGRAGAALERRPVDVVRGGQVLDRDPQRLEERDLIRRASPGNATQKSLADLPDDVILSDRAL